MAIQWPLAIFSLLAGCGGGMLAFMAFAEVKGFGVNRRFPLAVAALVLIVVGGCASVAHLGNPANIMAAAANIGSLSGISVELIFLGASAVFAAAYAVAVKRGASAGARKAIAIIAGVLGVILAFVTGNGYVMESQVNIASPANPLTASNARNRATSTIAIAATQRLITEPAAFCISPSSGIAI